MEPYYPLRALHFAVVLPIALALLFVSREDGMHTRQGGKRSNRQIVAYLPQHASSNPKKSVLRCIACPEDWRQCNRSVDNRFSTKLLAQCKKWVNIHAVSSSSSQKRVV